TITVTFTDPGSLDTFVATIGWGDGSATQTVALPAGTTSFTASHLYADDNPTNTSSDQNNVTITVADDDTGTGSGSAAVTVSNVAPSGVSVTPSATAFVE